MCRNLTKKSLEEISHEIHPSKLTGAKVLRSLTSTYHPEEIVPGSTRGSLHEGDVRNTKLLYVKFRDVVIRKELGGVLLAFAADWPMDSQHRKARDGVTCV